MYQAYQRPPGTTLADFQDRWISGNAGIALLVAVRAPPALLGARRQLYT